MLEKQLSPSPLYKQITILREQALRLVFMRVPDPGRIGIWSVVFLYKIVQTPHTTQTQELAQNNRKKLK